MSVNLKVKLYTGNGHFVHQAEIPPFRVHPDTIIWGNRCFRYSRDELLGDPKERYHIYTEGFVYVLPDTDPSKVKTNVREPEAINQGAVHVID